MYTKYTDTIYSEQSWIPYVDSYSSYKSAAKSTADTLAQEGKTDTSLISYPAPYTVRRVWIDQAAADEWKTYLTQLAIDYGATVQITIGDL
jgi:hypothetical protein